MHSNYQDILSRIEATPDWYDSNGTPRYGLFGPDRCPNIYSDCVCLLLIACQACNNKFKVEMHSTWYMETNKQIPKKWHYGDPPVHDCVGDTMNCDDLKVLEVWTRSNMKWKRVKKLEGLIDAE